MIARLIYDMYQKYGALPLAISLIQDNTPRECKKATDDVEFSVNLVVLNCVESFTYLYPEKGHAHRKLDATFGQTCVKLSLE